MSGDDLTIALFLFGTAIAFGLTAVTLAGWTHRTLVLSFFGAAIILFLSAVFWPTIGEHWSGLKTLLNEIVANYLAFRLIILFVLLMFCFDFAMKMGWISVRAEALAERPRASTEDDAGEETANGTERKVVDAEPSYLMGLYQGTTKIRADRLAAIYVGKWLRVSGSVYNVGSSLGVQIVVVLQEEGQEEPRLFLVFNESWAERLELLHPKQEIKALGKIERISSTTIDFRECELID